LINIRSPPPFLLTANRPHPGRGTTTNSLVPKNLHKPNYTPRAIFNTEPSRLPTHDASLLEQSSAQSLCDCLHQVVCHARQALLANHADQTLTLSTDLLSNCSIASNAPRSACPLDFVAMHPHLGGITAHTSCAGMRLCIEPNQKE